MENIVTDNTLVYLCEVGSIPADRGLKICKPNMKPLAVFQHVHGISVTDDKCSHGNASLAEGEVDGTEIECPLHSGAFDLITGEPTEAPCSIPINVHRSVLKDGKVYLVVLND